MPPEMTSNERIARMERINDLLLDELERDLDKPAWYPYAVMVGGFAAGALLFVGGVIFAKHIL